MVCCGIVCGGLLVMVWCDLDGVVWVILVGWCVCVCGGVWLGG